jgi:biotin carboxylase
MTIAPLLILAGGTYQLPLIHAARRRGVPTALLDGDAGALGFRHADSGEVVDIADSQAVIAAARRIKPIGVASIVNEVSVTSVAAAADALGLPGIGTDVAVACTDKFVMRTRVKHAGMPCPEFATVETASGAARTAAGIGYPVVVKPVDNSGSRGVRRVDGPAEIEPVVIAALSQSKKRQAIIEGFLDGTEFTVETLTVDGQTEVLGISEKTRLPFPHCVSISLTYFPFQGMPVAEGIADAAKRAIAAVGLRNGPGHVEVMQTSDGPVVIELAARGGGYRIFSDILPAISGVDAVEAVIDQALGLSPRTKPVFRRGAVLRFFNPSATGILRSVAGVREAGEVEGVLDVVIEAKLGKPYRGITRDGERPGYIITAADTREGAVSAADIAERKVVFTIEPEPGGHAADSSGGAETARGKGGLA